MTFADAFSALLWSNAGVQAAAPGGISRILLPEGATLPAIAWQIVGGESDPTFSTSGAQKRRVQLDCFAADADSAEAARAAITSFLNGYQGLLGDGTYLQAALLIQPIDGFNNDSRQFRLAVEFYIFFNFQGA